MSQPDHAAIRERIHNAIQTLCERHCTHTRLGVTHVDGCLDMTTDLTTLLEENDQLRQKKNHRKGCRAIAGVLNDANPHFERTCDCGYLTLLDENARFRKALEDVTIGCRKHHVQVEDHRECPTKPNEDCELCNIGAQAGMILMGFTPALDGEGGDE